MLAKIRLLVSIVLSFLIFPSLAFAQEPTPLCGIGADNPADFTARLYGCGISLVGGVALLFIIYGGFVLVTSAGDPNKLRIGKEYITYAIVGLVLALVTFILLEVVGVDILNIPGIR